MSIKEKKSEGRGLYALPLLAAFPLIAAMIAGAIFFWPDIRRLLSILIKLAVKA